MSNLPGISRNRFYFKTIDGNINIPLFTTSGESINAIYLTSNDMSELFEKAQFFVGFFNAQGEISIEEATGGTITIQGCAIPGLWHGLLQSGTIDATTVGSSIVSPSHNIPCFSGYMDQCRIVTNGITREQNSSAVDHLQAFIIRT